jgi:hypothetical protein
LKTDGNSQVKEFIVLRNPNVLHQVYEISPFDHIMGYIYPVYTFTHVHNINFMLPCYLSLGHLSGLTTLVSRLNFIYFSFLSCSVNFLDLIILTILNENLCYEAFHTEGMTFTNILLKQERRDGQACNKYGRDKKSITISIEKPVDETNLEN